MATTDAQQRIGEPEGAGQEDAFGTGQPVVAGLGTVAQEKAVFGQVPPNGVNRADHARVVMRQEADPGDQQQAGVEFGAAVGLDEGVPFFVEAACHDVGMEFVP